MPDSININTIIKQIAASDSAGADSTQIDTLLEYEKLGSYLNGNCNKKDFEIAYSDLNKKAKNELKTLYANLKTKFSVFLKNEKSLPGINMDNAAEYIKIQDELSWNRERNDEEELVYQKLTQALYKFAKENGGNVENIDADNCNFETIILHGIVKPYNRNMQNKKLADESLKKVYKQYNNKNLKLAVKEFIKNNSVEKQDNNDDTSVDLGNGKFDKPATQTTNLCWAHAGINTLLKTETGTQLIENNKYYDEKTGIFAIHLQEAEDNGFHNGIYIITPDDIKQEGPSLSKGEGDVTAYMIAIKRYFNEVQSNPELTSKMEDEGHSVRDIDLGNTSFRFFELISGGKHVNYKELAKSDLQNGIGTGRSLKIPFDFVYETVDKQKGSVILALNDHAISVVGTKDGKLIVQESNNDTEFPIQNKTFLKNKIIFNRVEDINGAPAYELNQEDYVNNIDAISYLKWKE